VRPPALVDPEETVMAKSRTPAARTAAQIAAQRKASAASAAKRRGKTTGGGMTWAQASRGVPMGPNYAQRVKARMEGKKYESTPVHVRVGPGLPAPRAR